MHTIVHGDISMHIFVVVKQWCIYHITVNIKWNIITSKECTWY